MERGQTLYFRVLGGRYLFAQETGVPDFSPTLFYFKIGELQNMLDLQRVGGIKAEAEGLQTFSVIRQTERARASLNFGKNLWLV